MANKLLFQRANATPLLRGMLAITDNIGLVSIPLPVLGNPNYTPIRVLPWLAWGLSVDRWRTDWSEARQRQEVAQAIPTHKRRGSRRAMDLVLADYDASLRLLEWWEEGGTGIPYTFLVDVLIDGSGSLLSTGAFANDLAADIARAKPARAHFQIRQKAAAVSVLPMVAVARSFTFARLGASADTDFSIDTENDEPLEGDGGNFLEAQ